MFNKFRTFRKNNFHKNFSWITPRLTTTWFIVGKTIILGAEFYPINIGVGVFQMSNDIRIWENMIKSCKRSNRMSKKWIWVVLSKIDFFHSLGIKKYLHCLACEQFGISYSNEFLQKCHIQKVHTLLNIFYFYHVLLRWVLAKMRPLAFKLLQRLPFLVYDLRNQVYIGSKRLVFEAA